MLASRVRVVVLVSRLYPPTLRALAYARALDAASVEAITVQLDAGATNRLWDAWLAEDIDVPLTAVEASGDLVAPVVEHIARIRMENPSDLVAVFIPQYVVGTWWEGLLHHRPAHRLSAALGGMDGVMVTTVPWQLNAALQRWRDMVASSRRRTRRIMGS